MIIINNYNEIKSKIVKIGGRFEVQKGNRKAIYKIIESVDFEGCYALLRCENIGYSGGTYVLREKHLTGCGSIEGCMEQAYDIT